MVLQLLRFGHGTDSTGGILSVNGRFSCYTCEDQHQNIKVPGETRIPEGRYRIKLRAAGGMHAKYAKRYPFHRGMLWLQDVDGFEWIYIHTGNDDDDTRGCILVGLSQTAADGEYFVQDSRLAYTALYREILEAFDRGEGVSIEIIDI